MPGYASLPVGITRTIGIVAWIQERLFGSAWFCPLFWSIRLAAKAKGSLGKSLIASTPRRPEAEGTRAHRERAEAAKEFLAARYRTPLTLVDIARGVQPSRPYACVACVPITFPR